MPRPTHRCAAPGCEEQIGNHLLMCRTHWYQVPKPIRDKVFRTYRNRTSDFGAYMEAVEEAEEAVTP